MAKFGGKWRVLRSILTLSLNFMLAFVLVSAERGLKREFTGVPAQTDEGLSSLFLKAANFLWQPNESGYHHVWPVKC